jgi:hypothetical protein
LAPTLSLSDELALDRVPRLAFSAGKKAARRRMSSDGFLTEVSLLSSARCDKMRAGVEALRHAGLHELFALLYDEFWISLAEGSGIVEDVLGKGLAAILCPYVNYVPPGSHGFSVHRDRYSHAVAGDGLPNVVTTWFSLTDAGPEQACLGMLPARFDINFPDQLTRQEIGDLRDLRSLPVPIGSMVCFNLTLLHWGTRNVSARPRVSFAFELARAEFPREEPNVPLRQPLTFTQRAHFIGRSIDILRNHRIEFSKKDLAHAAVLRGLIGAFERTRP